MRFGAGTVDLAAARAGVGRGSCIRTGWRGGIGDDCRRKSRSQIYGQVNSRDGKRKEEERRSKKRKYIRRKTMQVRQKVRNSQKMMAGLGRFEEDLQRWILNDVCNTKHMHIH